MRISEFTFYVLLTVWQYLKYFVWKPKSEFEKQNPNYYTASNFNEIDALISAKNPYYAGLSYLGKVKFQGRLKFVKSAIQIQGREDFEITKEVRTLICACITQLTFGFNKPVMPFLKGVVVFPGIFYSRLAENWVKGLALGNGVVFISWKDFEEGYHFSTATYNLGLHEFAHMLRLQALKGEGFDARLVNYFDDWEANGYEVFKRIRHGNEDFFREYAGENKAEFFSVCIENFFEVPKSFSEELPDVYWHLCHLLRQNPLNIANDYSFEEQETKEVNTILDEKIPTGEPWHLPFENKVIPIFQFFGIIGLLILFIVFMANKQSDVSHWFFAEMRTILFGLIIIKIFRYYHYKELNAVHSLDNLNYTVRILTPVLVVLTLILDLIITILISL